MNYRHQLFTAAADGAKQGSGLRRIVCLTALLVIFVTGARAYDLKVGGVTVTSSNASNVTGSNIKAYSSSVNGGKPSVVYNNSTKTLTLWNVEIDREGTDNRAILNDGISGLTIILKGTNCLRAWDASPVRLNANTTLKSQSYDGEVVSVIQGGSEDALTVGNGATLTITDANLYLTSKSSCFDAKGSPSLIIQNSIVTAKCTYNKSNDCYALFDYNKLTIQNSTVNLQGYSQAIKNLTTLTLGNGMFIESPSGAKFNSTSKTVVTSSGSAANPVVFKPSTAINSTNFPDGNFRNWLLSQSYGSDGYLTPTEIQNVTSMTVSGKSISKLTGIELFTELTYLNCSNNALTSLDVSKNTKLQTFYCFSNQLTALNLSQNKSLKDVFCYGNKIRGSYASTFISNLPSTSSATLYFYDNETSTGNSMTFAQVSDAKLKGWSVMQRNSSSNWVNYLGSDAIAINSTNFTDANFRNWIKSQSYGSDGYLTPTEIQNVTSMNVSGKSISDLKGIEYFTELTYLNCSNNNLTSLDLSNNVIIQTLYCNNNQLTTLNIKKNVKYMDVYCYGNKIDESGGVTYLMNHLPIFKGTLYFYKNETATGNWMLPVSVSIIKDYGWAIKQANNNGSWKDYEGEDAIAVIKANFPDENFRNWISEQSYGADGWIIQAEIAQLTEIDVDVKGIKSLEGIEYFTALKRLDCDDNKLTDLDVSQNTALERLSCGSNQLTELVVSNNTKLKRLDCYNNLLTSLDVSQNPALIYLGCGANRLTTLDVSNHTAMEALSCYNNQLTKLNVSGCTALWSIECYGNKLKGKEMTAFVNSLERMASVSYSDKGLFVRAYKDDNMMTPAQVKIATDKDWYVLTSTGDDYEGENIPGDANGDGEVTAQDIDCLRDYILGLDPESFSPESADLNESGTVDIVDLTLLIEKLKE